MAEQQGMDKMSQTDKKIRPGHLSGKKLYLKEEKNETMLKDCGQF